MPPEPPDVPEQPPAIRADEFATPPSGADDPAPPPAPRKGEPTILAMGGGGFTMEPDNPALDDFVLSLTTARMPRICLLPTASGDGEAQIRQFHTTFRDRACDPSHIALFRLGKNPVPLRETLLSQDVIYVGGGSMLGLLAVWRALGLDAILRECWEAGVVLAGLSAGAMCWFDWGVSTSVGAPAPAPGLGLLPGSMSVHMDGEPSRLPIYRRAVEQEMIPPGWAADDGVGLVFRGRVLTEVVTSRPNTRAVRVEADRQVPLVPRALCAGRSAADRHAPPPPDVIEFRRHAAARRRGA